MQTLSNLLAELVPTPPKVFIPPTYNLDEIQNNNGIPYFNQYGQPIYQKNCTEYPQHDIPKKISTENSINTNQASAISQHINRTRAAIVIAVAVVGLSLCSPNNTDTQERPANASDTPN